MYAAMGLAVLVKGPIGVLLPGSIVGLYLLMRDPVDEGICCDWLDRPRLVVFASLYARTHFRAMWSMRPFTAMAMVLAVAGPWFALVGIRTGGNFLREFFGVQNYGRFMGAMDNHSGGIWYYPLVMMLGFFPWSIFGIPTMLDVVKRSCGSGDPWQRGSKFLACWIVVYVGFFSLAATKLPNYVLPAYPGLALATGCLIERWLKRPEGVRSLWPRLSLGSLVLVGCLAIAALLWVGKGSIHGRPVLAQLGVSETLASDIVLASSLGVILLVGGCVAIFFAETRRATAAMVGVTVTALTFCLTMFAGIAVKVDRHQPSPVLAEAIREHAGDRAEIAQFGYFRPSLVYYTDSRVEACKTPQRLVEFLQQPNSVVVTNEDQYSRLAAELPADVIVVDKISGVSTSRNSSLSWEKKRRWHSAATDERNRYSNGSAQTSVRQHDVGRWAPSYVGPASRLLQRTAGQRDANSATRWY